MSRPDADDATPLSLLEVGLSTPLDTYVVAKLERLAARGLSVSAAITPEPGEALPKLNGVEILPQPHWAEPTARMLAGIAVDVARLSIRHPRSLWRAVRATGRGARRGRFARLLRAYLPLAAARPDVVHFEWGSAAIKYQPLTDVWGCPIAVSCHGSEVNVRPHLPGGGRFAGALAGALSQAAVIHCVSEAVAAEAQRLGAPPRRIRVIRSAADVDIDIDIDVVDDGGAVTRQDDRTGSEDRLRIVSVGQLRWLKGHEYAVRALRLLHDQGVSVSLDVIGADPAAALAEPSERARLNRLLTQLQMENHGRIVGALPHAEVIDRLRQADVLLHASVSEGCGVAVLEAMACALPVVVADYPAAAEIVNHGETGLIVARRSPQAAAAALRRLHEDPALARRLGAAAREHVKRHFGVEERIDEFSSLYADLVRGPALDASAARIERRRGNPGPADLRVLAVGGWEWMDGYDTVMAAVRLLADHGVNCQCRIAGSGPCREALWFARYQLGLTDHVQIVEEQASLPQGHINWADVVLDPQAGESAGALADRLAAMVPHHSPRLRAASVQPRVQPVRSAWASQ